MSADKKPAGAEPTPEDETKRKFREALAAKQGRKVEDNSDRKGEDLDTGPQHVHSHGPIDTKRTFRRKTG
jgi:hypothetical protein